MLRESIKKYRAFFRSSFVQIELLWIIPIIAFAFFIFILIFFAQKKEENPYRNLSEEVARFNNGMHAVAGKKKQTEDRLGDIEKSISFVTESIASQQKAIERFHKENNSHNSEIDELKKKLRDLYKEYDIVLSENYSLRAKVKKLVETKKPQPEEEPEIAATGTFGGTTQIQNPGNTKHNLRLYEDTRLMNIAALDDTSEIDLSEYRK